MLSLRGVFTDSGIATVNRPSVRLSVTFVYPDYTALYFLE